MKDQQKKIPKDTIPIIQYLLKVTRSMNQFGKIEMRSQMNIIKK